jgi:hypothetical protein
MAGRIRYFESEVSIVDAIYKCQELILDKSIKH